MVNFISNYKLTSPPDVKEFFKLKFWAIHEAAFALTNWPDKDLTYYTIHNLPEEIRNERSWFIFPNKKFDPENYEVFNQMKRAIEYGVLPAMYVPLFSGLCHLIKPIDVILWALVNDFVLPEPLQEVVGVYQFKPSGRRDTLINKVKNKIVAQFKLAVNSEIPLKSICEDDFMQVYGTGGQSVVSRYKTIEKQINELFWRKGNKNQNRKYTFEAIPEIIRKTRKGIEYNIPLLLVGMTTAAHIKIDQRFSSNLSDNSLDSFVNDFLTDDIVRFYLDEAPAIIKELVIRHITFLYPEL